MPKVLISQAHGSDGQLVVGRSSGPLLGASTSNPLNAVNRGDLGDVEVDQHKLPIRLRLAQLDIATKTLAHRLAKRSSFCAPAGKPVSSVLLKVGQCRI